jgi:penicillin-binding protein 1A
MIVRGATASLQALKRFFLSSATLVVTLAGVGACAVRGTVAWSLTRLGGVVAAGSSAAAWSVIVAVSSVPALLRLGCLSLRLSLIASPVIVAGFFAVCALANPFVSASLDYAHDRSSATEVFDADGRWIGIIPPSFFTDWSNGRVLPPDHVAVPPVTIPPVWRRCISYLEDRSAFDGISSRLGFNPAALVKAGVQTVFFHKRRGASTLLMQVVRTLNGQSPSADEPIGAVALRKLAELVGATTLARMLYERDPDMMARYIGMHLPLVIGAAGSGFGDEINGIELASRILFGRSAEELPPEEQAILAAAVKTPVVLAPPSDRRGQRLALERWARIKLRAAYCLDHGFAPDSADIAAARERLSKLPLPTPFVDPHLTAQLPADRRKAWQIVVNPVRRSLYFFGPDVRLAEEELDRAFKSDWRGKVVAIHLTTSAADGRATRDAIIGRLRRLQASVPGLLLDLVNPGAADAAQVVAAVTDDKGRLRELYSSNEGLFLTRKTELGSTAKMIAAVVLSRRTEPGTPYCRAPIPGMTVARSEDQTVCRERSQWLTARDAFARSVSPAVNWALRHYSSPTQMETVAAAFGLPAFGDVPPATALSLGIVELTPAEMLRMTAAIGEVLNGEAGDAPFPTIIAAATVLGADGIARQQPVSVGESLSGQRLQAVIPRQAKSFLRNVLAATSDPGGTLATLGPLKQQLAGQLYAKTGTVSVRGRTQALQIAGIFMHAGRPWSFSIMIATPENERPLGRNLAAGQFASLVPLLLHGAVSAPSVAPVTRTAER